MFRFQPLFPGFESAELVSGGDLTLPEEMEFGSLGRGSSSHRSCFTLRTLFRKSNLIPCALDEEEGEGRKAVVSCELAVWRGGSHCTFVTRSANQQSEGGHKKE